MGCEQSSETVDPSNRSRRSSSLNPLVPPAQGGDADYHQHQNGSGGGGVLSHRLICHPQLTQEIMAYLPAGIGYARLMKKNRGDAYSVATAEEILARQQAALRDGQDEETIGRRNSIMNLRPASASTTAAVAGGSAGVGTSVASRPGAEKAPQGGSATSKYDGGWLTLRLVNSRCKAAVDYFVVDRVCEGIITRFVALDEHGYRPRRTACSGGEIALASLLPYAIGEQDDEDRRAQEVLRQRYQQAARDANRAPPRSKLLSHYATRGDQEGAGNTESSGENVEETERARKVQMAHLSRFNQIFEEEAQQSPHDQTVWSNRIQERLNELVFGGGIEEENVMKAQFAGVSGEPSAAAAEGVSKNSSGVRLNTISEVQGEAVRENENEDDDDEGGDNFLDRVASGAAAANNGAAGGDLVKGSSINQIKYRILIVDDIVLPHPVMLGGNIITSLQVGQYAHEQYKKRSRRSVDRQAQGERVMNAEASLRRNPVKKKSSSQNGGVGAVDPSQMDPWSPSGVEGGESFLVNDALGTENGEGSVNQNGKPAASRDLGTLHANAMQKMLIIPLPYAIAEDFARERLRKRPIAKKIITSNLTPPDGDDDTNPLSRVPSAVQGYYSPASIKKQNSSDFKGIGAPASLNNSNSQGALSKSNSATFSGGVKERKKSSSLGRIAGGRRKDQQESQQAAKKAAAASRGKETAVEKANRLRQEEAWRKEDIEIQKTLGLAADRQTQIENMISAPALEIRSSAPLGKFSAGVMREAPIKSAQFSVQGFTTLHTIGEDFARECPNLETLDISSFYSLREIEDNFCYASKRLREVILGSKEESSRGFAHVMTFDAEIAPKGFVNLEYIGRNFLYRCSSFVSDGLETSHPARQAESGGSGGVAVGDSSGSSNIPRGESNSRSQPVSDQHHRQGIDTSTSLNFVSAFAHGEDFFPKLRQIDHGFMVGCATITRIELANLPCLESLGDDCLMGCRVLSGVIVGPCPSLKKIGTRFCSKNKSLTSVLLRELPHLKQLGGGFLQECSELRALDLRQCQSLATIGPDFCHSCSTLKSLNLKGLDELLSIGQGMLMGCPLVKDIEIDTSNVNELLAEALWDRK